MSENETEDVAGHVFLRDEARGEKIGTEASQPSAINRYKVTGEDDVEGHANKHFTLDSEDDVEGHKHI